MALRTESTWIPIEMDSGVIAKVALESAIEFLGARVPMGSNARSVPRDSGVDSKLAAHGDTYTGDAEADDVVTLKTFKFTGAVDLTSEDLHDAPQNLVLVRSAGWMRSNNIMMDNATLGVTGAQSDTISNARPYTSLYYAVRHDDTDAGYTGDANYTSSATLSGTGGYATLLTALALYESSDYYDPSRSVMIADPALKSQFRGVVDKNGRPIFEDTVYGTIDGHIDEAASREVPNILGYPCVWTKGARTTPTATRAPTGKPLVIVGNRDHLLWGISGETPTPQSRAVVQPNADITKLMFRVRRGFHTGFPQAFSVLELTA